MDTAPWGSDGGVGMAGAAGATRPLTAPLLTIGRPNCKQNKNIYV